MARSYSVGWFCLTARTYAPAPSRINSAISFWQPIASIVTTAPVTSSNRSNSGIAVISLDFSSTTTWPSDNSGSIVRRIWGDADAGALSPRPSPSR
jgi:hypothetical protein